MSSLNHSKPNNKYPSGSHSQANAISPMIPAIERAPGADKPIAASGVGVEEDAEPADDPEPEELVESWLLVPLELELSVVVAEVEAAVPVPVPVLVDEPLAVVAAEL
jgi:hypothetical protein